MKCSKPNRQSGSAVIMMLGLLTLVLVTVSANTASVRNLDRELKLLNQRQIRHWQPNGISTNETVIRQP
jgi:hypothetical protein